MSRVNIYLLNSSLQYLRTAGASFGSKVRALPSDLNTTFLLSKFSSPPPLATHAFNAFLFIKIFLAVLHSALPYYSVLHSTEYTTLYYTVLLRTTQYYTALIRTTPYYTVLLRTTKYYSELLCTTQYYRTTKDYTVLQNILLCTTQYYFLLHRTNPSASVSVPEFPNPSFRIQVSSFRIRVSESKFLNQASFRIRVSESARDHFLKFRCRKITRRCGARHICKSKCTKYLCFGTLFEVQMSKN